jgi:hypothetical protein
MDDLTKFKDWWLKTRPFSVPHDEAIAFDDNIRGLVLYRAECWQVQLFILDPNTNIPEHLHPNVDSFEVFLTGDIEFTINGQVLTRRSDTAGFSGSSVHYGKFIRVSPTTWHGGKSADVGGTFLSIQQWLNGVKPTNVGNDWVHQPNQDKRNYANT